MFVVSQFWWIGFDRAAIRPTRSQGFISEFHPALHARPHHVTFPPHGNGSGMGQNSRHPRPQVVTTSTFEWHLWFKRHNNPGSQYKMPVGIVCYSTIGI